MPRRHFTSKRFIINDDDEYFDIDLTKLDSNEHDYSEGPLINNSIYERAFDNAKRWLIGPKQLFELDRLDQNVQQLNLACNFG